MRWSEGGKFENPEPGSHLARCYAVIDLGTQEKHYKDEKTFSRQVRISFELPQSLMEGLYNPEMKGKPFTAHLHAKQSLHKASNLRKHLEGWRGKRFEQVELDAYDPKNLLGKCCRLSLILSESGYVNIDSIAPAKKDEVASMPKQINPSVFFSLAPEEFEQRVFDALSDKTKEKIKGTPEWAFLNSPRGAVAMGGDPQGETTPDDGEVPF